MSRSFFVLSLLLSVTVAHGHLTPWTPRLYYPIELRMLQRRQSNDCSAAGLLTCENGCMQIGWFCCDDGTSTSCPDDSTCVPNGCCPIGARCGGGGGTSTFTAAFTTTATEDSTPSPITGTFNDAFTTPEPPAFTTPDDQTAFPTTTTDFFDEPTATAAFTEPTFTEPTFTEPSFTEPSFTEPTFPSITIPTIIPTQPVAGGGPAQAAGGGKVKIPVVPEQIVALVAGGMLLL